MKYKKYMVFFVIAGLILMMVGFFLFKQFYQASTEPVKVSGELQPLYRFQDKQTKFTRIIGWMGNQEVLVQAVYDSEDRLYIFNIRTGEHQLIYKSITPIMTVSIAKSEEKILIQRTNKKESIVDVLDPSGKVLFENTLPTRNSLYVNWNRANYQNIFLSFTKDDGSNKGKVYNWNLLGNKMTEMPDHSDLKPTWYSENLYVFMAKKNPDDAVHQLYLVDKRTDKPQLIGQDIVDYYANGDSYILFEPSDFTDGDLFLQHQYPFMIDKDKTTVPTTLVGKQMNVPFLAQAHEQDEIYGVFTEESKDLLKEPAKYMLGKIDFEHHTVEKIMTLPEAAPIMISENQHYLLFGWYYEYVIDLHHDKITDVLGVHDQDKKKENSQKKTSQN